MDIAYPRAALDLIASTLLISMGMLLFSQIALRGERMRFSQSALVVASLVLQASCVGTAWLHEGKGTASTVLLVMAIAALLGLVMVAIRRDPFWERFRK
jgi:hypothetical protein